MMWENLYLSMWLFVLITPKKLFAVKETEILKLDRRGRIVIPRIMRKSLGLTEHTQLLAISDSEEKKISLVPLQLAEDRVYIKIKINSMTRKQITMIMARQCWRTASGKFERYADGTRVKMTHGDIKYRRR